jgi:serine/threonine protein kinase
VSHLDETVLSTTTDYSTSTDRRCPACGIAVPVELERCPNDGTPLSSPIEGDLATRYELLEPIGKGGMSVVYKARHRLMGNLVAIKLLQDKLTENVAHVKRFQQEAQAAGRLDHSNLIKVYDFGVLSSGYTFLVMDYADGRSLSDLVRAEGRLGGARALPIMMQICEGLSHAHAKGILHRDLKPSNVIVIQDPDSGERVKVVDFGIAKMTAEEGDSKLTATGEVFGSPYYMSPEQCTGATVDPRSDIYSMGCLMYEVLTGKVPLSGANVFETIHKQINEAPEPLAKLVTDPVSVALSDVVDRALQKDPTARYQSFADMLVDLRSVGAGKSVQKIRRPSRKKAPVAAIAGLVVAGSAAAFSIFVPPSTSPPAVPPVHTVTVPMVAVPPGAPAAGMTPRQIAVIEINKYPATNQATIRSAGLNDKGMALLAHNRSALSVNVQDNPDVTSQGVAQFANHQTLQKLNLDGTSVSDEGLRALGKLPKLEFLTIGNTQVTSRGFKYLSNFPQLSELWLEEMNLTDNDFAGLPVLPNVRRLKLDHNPLLSDAAIPVIARKFPNLDLITLRGAGITDGAVPELFKLNYLTRICVYGTHLTPKGESALRAHKKGFSVDWGQTFVQGTNAWRRSKGMSSAVAGEFHSVGGMTDNAMKVVAGDKTISHINVSESIDLTSRGIVPLKDNHGVRFLNVCGTSVDDDCMPVIATMKGLKKLELSRTRITSAGLKYLTKLENLQALTIGNLGLTNADLQRDLPSLPGLDSIVLDNNKNINDAGVRVLIEKCPNLTTVTLRGTDVTDATVDTLLKLKHLKKASLRATRVSKEAKARLQQHQITLY